MIRAVLLDFNGTLSDDEPLLYAVYAELFARHGRPLSQEAYLERLAGLSEEAIFEAWLGPAADGHEGLMAERVARYAALAADGRTIGGAAREAVRLAAARGPVGIVSGAFRREIEPVVRAAGLADVVAFVVAADDVRSGKPDPEGYLRALELLGGDVAAPEVLAVEDTEVGVAAASAAGLRVAAVTGTLPPGRLARADVLVHALEPAALEALLAAP